MRYRVVFGRPACVHGRDHNHGGTRTRNPQIRSLMRYPLRHAVRVHPVGFEPTPPERLGLKSNALDQLGHGYDTIKCDRYVIRTRNLQDWNLTRCRCANRSKCIRWGSNPRLRRDWGLNPTPFWFIVDERPTRPRILNGRRAISHTLVNTKQLRRDSNPQPPDSKSDTLSIAPRSCFLCIKGFGGAGV